MRRMARPNRIRILTGIACNHRGGQTMSTHPMSHIDVDLCPIGLPSPRLACRWRWPGFYLGESPMSSEIDRQTPPQEPELAQKREKDAETAQQASAKAAEQVRLGPLDSEETPKGEAGAPPVEIPETRAVQLARAALQTAPQGSTAEQMDALVRRKAAVTTAVRKALVQEEITRRAQWQEDDAQTRMTGQPPAPAHI